MSCNYSIQKNASLNSAETPAAKTRIEIKRQLCTNILFFASHLPVIAYKWDQPTNKSPSNSSTLLLGIKNNRIRRPSSLQPLQQSPRSSNSPEHQIDQINPNRMPHTIYFARISQNRSRARTRIPLIRVPIRAPTRINPNIQLPKDPKQRQPKHTKHKLPRKFWQLHFRTRSIVNFLRKERHNHMDSCRASRQESDNERKHPFRVPGAFGRVVVMYVLAVEAYDCEAEDELEEAEGGNEHVHCLGAFADLIGGFGGVGDV